MTVFAPIPGHRAVLSAMRPLHLLLLLLLLLQLSPCSCSSVTALLGAGAGGMLLGVGAGMGLAYLVWRSVEEPSSLKGIIARKG